MKTKDIIELDYRKKENKQIIKKALLNIKPLSKYSENEHIPLESLEKLLHMLSTRYCIWVRDITQDSHGAEDTDIWRCEVIYEDTLHSEKIYGVCIYEIFSKLIIFLWSEKKKQKLKRR